MNKLWKIFFNLFVLSVIIFLGVDILYSFLEGSLDQIDMGGGNIIAAGSNNSLNRF